MKHNVFEDNCEFDIDYLDEIGFDQNNQFCDFLINKSLYSTMEITEANHTELLLLLSGKVKAEIYCVECKEKRPFRVYHTRDYKGCGTNIAEYINSSWHRMLVGGTATGEKYLFVAKTLEEMNTSTFIFRCTMNPNHYQAYTVIYKNNQVIKIGQYPSLADLTCPQYKKYAKLLKTDYMPELKRAIGLNAQGIGIGAFVYLRRIFEGILEMAKQNAEKDGKLEIENYTSLKTSEKVKKLKDYLPDFINENRIFYGIVSKGIHELTEDDCNEYFPVLKDCIIYILEDWEEKKQKEKNRSQLTKQLSEISSNMSGSSK